MSESIKSTGPLAGTGSGSGARQRLTARKVPMTAPQNPVRQADRLYHDLLSPDETREGRDRVRKMASDVVAPVARRIANGDERGDGVLEALSLIHI